MLVTKKKKNRQYSRYTKKSDTGFISNDCMEKNQTHEGPTNGRDSDPAEYVVGKLKSSGQQQGCKTRLAGLHARPVLTDHPLVVTNIAI